MAPRGRRDRVTVLARELSDHCVVDSKRTLKVLVLSIYGFSYPQSVVGVKSFHSLSLVFSFMDQVVCPVARDTSRTNLVFFICSPCSERFSPLPLLLFSSLGSSSLSFFKFF